MNDENDSLNELTTDNVSCETRDDTDALKCESGFIVPYLQTKQYMEDGTIVYGVTLQGRIHKQLSECCQDYHLFSNLGDAWHLYIVSDGAGSAKASDRGSRWNCVIAEYLIRGLIERTDWKYRSELPTELEWYQEFFAICRKVKSVISERVENLDENISPKDFNATLLVLLVTPKGMLMGHIGDGRMGYRNKYGEWHSIMKPHKGEEANQTVFLMNNWDSISIPTLKLNGVSVPEVMVVKEKPEVVAILTDGCENFSWNCLQMSEKNCLEDINTPFAGFWDPLVLSVCENDEEKRLADFITFVDSNTDECRNEQDDRTMMLGIYKQNGTYEG